MTSKGLPRNVWILGFGSLLMDMSSETIHSLLPLFLVSTLGAQVMSVGLIEGAAEAVASVLRVFSGALSDYFQRRKPLIVAGYSLSALAKPLFALAGSVPLVFLARVCDRVGKGIRGAPRDALVADSTTPDQRGAAYGLRQSLDTVGAIIGPLMALAILTLHPQQYRLAFTIAVIPAWLTVLLLFFGLKEMGEQEDSNNKVRQAFAPGDWKSLPGSYWSLVAVAFVYNLGNSSDAFLLLKAKTLGLEDQFVPLVLVVFNAIYAATSYPAGLLTDKFGRHGMFIAGIILYAATYLGLAFATGIWQFWLLCLVYGLQLGLSQGTLLALISDRVPAALRGTAFGFLNLCIAMALLLASILAAYLWQTFSPSYAFMAGAGFALAGLLIYVLAARTIET